MACSAMCPTMESSLERSIPPITISSTLECPDNSFTIRMELVITVSVKLSGMTLQFPGWLSRCPGKWFPLP